MPELAEVEYFRKQWSVGEGQRILRVAAHFKARIFRGISEHAFVDALTGSKLTGSESRGKQMIFRFNGANVGLHLGMTGKLSVSPPDFSPGKHDHLVLYQKDQALMFSDSRLFGRVLFHSGKEEAPWWAKLPPDVLSPDFTKKAVETFLERRKGSPIKAVLLMQEQFPGIGNWMADEILWQARIFPGTRAGDLTKEEADLVWKITRHVTREALATVGKDWSDPPADWLFHHRWGKKGNCPRCGMELKRGEIGGRTTSWCSQCQKP